MDRAALWKNFRLGEELSVAGTFIYNGQRRFYELRSLDHADEIFEVFYDLSVGLERLMKIAIVLLEHDDSLDQEGFEKSLITHSHQELLGRLKQHKKIELGGPANDFLALLTTFYKTLRYDRFSLNSRMALGKENEELLAFLSKHLNVEFPKKDLTGNANDARFKKFLTRTVHKISSTIFEIVKDAARQSNFYTYELRHGSKAETVFLGGADIYAEEVLWKELLIFLMNTRETSGYIKFLRRIEPLDFDPALTGDYLDCFQSDSAKAIVIGELETLYENLPNKSERLETMEVIGDPRVHFDEDEDGEDDILLLDDSDDVTWPFDDAKPDDGKPGPSS